MRGKKFILGLLVLAAAGAAVLLPALFKIHSAKRVLNEQKQQSSRKGSVSVKVTNFSFARDPGLRLITASPEIHDVCEYQNRIYAATSSGLLAFSPDGKNLEKWSTADGLPSQDLTSIVAINDELWIGTSDSGLFRLHNGSWQEFTPEKPELRSVTSLLATKQGDLWIGTRSGIIKYSGHAFYSFHDELFGKQTITKLAGDSYRLMIGTFRDGFYVWERGTFRHFGIQDGLSDPMITDIHASEEECYVSTAAGIHVLHNNRLETVSSNLFVTSFVPGSEMLWAGTFDRGILPIKTSGKSLRTSRLISFEPAYVSRRPGPFFLRKIGKTFVAFSGNKSFYLDDTSRWIPWIQNEGFLSDQNISSLLISKNGDFWIGYFDRGIDVLSADLRLIRSIRDETFFCINHMSEDQDGRKYVSTANGLVIIEPDGTQKIYKEKDGLLSDRVMQALPLDPSGKRVGIATAQGYTIKEGPDFKSIYAFHGLVNNHVYSLAADGKKVFLGTLGGISSLSDMQVTENWTRMDSGLKRNWVNALAVVDHQLYVGTYGSGLQIRNGTGEWSDAIPADFEVNPNALFYDGQYLFCGTLDKGFYTYEPRTRVWKHFELGLPAQSVTSFASDANHIYAATDHGLLQISYDKINRLSSTR